MALCFWNISVGLQFLSYFHNWLAETSCKLYFLCHIKALQSIHQAIIKVAKFVYSVVFYTAVCIQNRATEEWWVILCLLLSDVYVFVLTARCKCWYVITSLRYNMCAVYRINFSNVSVNLWFLSSLSLATGWLPVHKSRHPRPVVSYNRMRTRSSLLIVFLLIFHLFSILRFNRVIDVATRRLY